MVAVEAQRFEAGWWAGCENTYTEETKQHVYARCMAVPLVDYGGPGPQIDLGGHSVLDLGGGPVSLLLKAANSQRLTVVDPCPYPTWVWQRYFQADPSITLIQAEAETYKSPLHYDEAWIYNVLQHVRDPEAVVQTARSSADLVRIFDWIDMPIYEGHPHSLSQEQLDEYFEAEGAVGELNEQGCVGRAYWGVFPQ